MAQIDGIRRAFGINRKDIDLPTANPILVIAKTPASVPVVLEIVFSPAVYQTGTIQFIDSISGLVIGTLTVPPAAAGNGVDQVSLKYGKTGTQLSAGANLIMSSSGVVVGRLHLETYQKAH